MARTSITSPTKRGRFKSQVLRLIRQQHLKPGDRILSEGKLAQRFNVAPLTVHRALREMAEEGHIYRVKGTGTFVGSGRPGNGEHKFAVVLAGPNLHTPEANPGNWNTVEIFMRAVMTHFHGPGTFANIIVPVEDQSPQRIRQLQQYDALFFIGTAEFRKLIDRLAQAGDPRLVVICEKADNVACLNLYHDRVENARLAVAHLAEHGYRKIAFLGAALGGRIKVRGYRQALEDYGLDYDEQLVVENLNSHADGPRGASILYGRGLNCDAIFVDTDIKALGVIQYLTAKGVRVPQDVAVMGGIGFDRFFNLPPYLTTWRLPTAAMVARAFEELAAATNTNAFPIKQIKLGGELIRGRTCGCDHVPIPSLFDTSTKLQSLPTLS